MQGGTFSPPCNNEYQAGGALLCREGRWGKHTAECREECGPLDLTQRHLLNGSKGLLLGQGAGTGWGRTLPALCEPGWAPSGKPRWDPVIEKLYVPKYITRSKW